MDRDIEQAADAADRGDATKPDPAMIEQFVTAAGIARGFAAAGAGPGEGSDE